MWMGAALPPAPPAGADFATLVEVATRSGMDSVWMGDHVLMVDGQRSRYPYSRDGAFPGAPDVAWHDWLIVLAHVAALDTGLRIGVAATVPVLRDPIVFAKQVATLDRLSGGRLTIGVGTGWLAEEFDALRIPFAGRGARLDAFLDVAREVWSGRPEEGTYGPYELPRGVVTLPTPVQRPIPVLIAGGGEAALRRAVLRGQGWLSVADPERDPIPVIREGIGRFRALETSLGADQAGQIVLRLPVRRRDVDTPELREYVFGLADSGVAGLICDVSWADPERAGEVLARVRENLEEVYR